jgi:hypothetical protein
VVDDTDVVDGAEEFVGVMCGPGTVGPLLELLRFFDFWLRGVRPIITGPFVVSGFSCCLLSSLSLFSLFVVE